MPRNASDSSGLAVDPPGVFGLAVGMRQGDATPGVPVEGPWQQLFCGVLRTDRCCPR